MNKTTKVGGGSTGHVRGHADEHEVKKPKAEAKKAKGPEMQRGKATADKVETKSAGKKTSAPKSTAPKSAAPKNTGKNKDLPTIKPGIGKLPEGPSAPDISGADTPRAAAFASLFDRIHKDAVSDNPPIEKKGAYFHPDIPGRKLETTDFKWDKTKVTALYDAGSGQVWYLSHRRHSHGKDHGHDKVRGPYKIDVPSTPPGPIIEMRPPPGPIIEMRPPGGGHGGPIIEMRPPPGPIIEMRPPPGPIIEMRPPTKGSGGPIIEMRPPPGPIIEMRPPEDNLTPALVSLYEQIRFEPSSPMPPLKHDSEYWHPELPDRMLERHELERTDGSTLMALYEPGTGQAWFLSDDIRGPFKVRLDEQGPGGGTGPVIEMRPPDDGGGKPIIEMRPPDDGGGKDGPGRNSPVIEMRPPTKPNSRS